MISKPRISASDEELPRDRLIEGMLEAFNGDPEHKCLGRTALTRLQRTLRHADEAGLAVARLREVYANRRESQRGHALASH